MPLSKDDVEDIKRELLFANSFPIVMPPGFAIIPLPDGAVWSERNGRDAPVPYRDPLDIAEDQDLVEVLDSEIVVLMEAAPRDPLDWELHLEACRECAASEGRLDLCAHCLDEKVILPLVFIPAHRPADEFGHFGVIHVCRQCKNSAHKGALDLE